MLDFGLAKALEGRFDRAVNRLNSDGTAFTVAAVGARVLFHRDDEGAVSTLTFSQGGVELAGKRVELAAPGAEELARYAGRYYSPELEAD